MGETFARGLRSIERRDGAALICLPALPPGTVFPEPLTLTLAPRGSATIVLPEATLDAARNALPPGTAVRVVRGLSVISAAGVCMSGAENKARRICAALARAGVRLYAVSLCDLGLTVTVSTDDAERTVDIMCGAVPLVL